MSAEVAETDRALRQIRGSNARKIIDHFTQSKTRSRCGPKIRRLILWWKELISLRYFTGCY